MHDEDVFDEGLRARLSEAILEAADRVGLGVAISLVEQGIPRNVFVNDAATRILGYSREELKTRQALANVAPEDRDRLAAIAQERAASGVAMGGRFELDVLHPDGRRVPIVSVASQLTLGGSPATVSFFWDVTDQRAAELARRAEGERLAKVMAGAPDGIFIVQKDSRVLYANLAGARLLGYEQPADVVGKLLNEHVVPEHIPTALARMEARARGETFPPLEYRGTRVDGSPVTVEVIAIPFEHEGKPALLSFARDVTERTAMREQLASAERLAVLGTLAAGIAHEVNNPLMAASLQVDLLRQSLGPLAGGPVRGALDELRDMHDRIAFIVRDLKLFARNDDGERTAVDLELLYRTTERMLAPVMRGKVRPTVSLAGLPPVVGSTLRLEQVFVNLIVNSLQALPEGRPNNRIEVRGYVKAPDRVCVEFVDNGTGIAPEHVERVFTPFFTTKPVGVGTGLGLPVVRDIVTKFGGDVEVASVLGEGTTVRVTFVVAGEPRAATPPPAPERGARRRKVLVVDDEPLLAETLGVLLGIRNDVEVYTDSDRALRRLLGEVPYDVVLCDLMMPGRSGMDLYAEVARERPPRAQRFVFMTGGAYTPTASEFAERLQGRQLLKPFEVQVAEALFAELGL